MKSMIANNPQRRFGMLKKQYFTVLIGLILCCYSSNIFAQEHTTKPIVLTRPIENSSVPMRNNEIRFSTDVSVDKNDKPIVFLKDPTNQWWPWLQTQSASEDQRNWELTRMQIGNSNDSGKIFTIQVIIFPSNDIDEGIKLNNTKIFIEGSTPIKNSIMRRLLNIYPLHSDPLKIQRR